MREIVQMEPSELRQLLTERFSEGELRTLCFDLSIDYDSLQGEGKADKARELVAFLVRRDRVRELLDQGSKLRPDIQWVRAPQAPKTSLSPFQPTSPEPPAVDVRLLMQPFFEHVAAFLAGPNLVAALMAQIVLAVFREASFDPARAARGLARLGFQTGERLLPEMVQPAQAGVKELTTWFENQLALSPQVNEGTAQVLVNQAEPIALALQDVLPNEKDQVAETMRAGLQAYGGATAEIASLYADALQDVSKVPGLIGEMQRKTAEWASQSVQAREDSLVRDILQVYTGERPINQSVSAGARSVISGVTQEQHTSTGSASQVISAGTDKD